MNGIYMFLFIIYLIMNCPDLPEKPERDLIPRIERLIGAKVLSCKPVQGGYTPATRLICQTAMASFFVKAGTTSLTCTALRREASVYSQVHGPFMPDLIAWEDDEPAPILVLEDLSKAEWPPPWTARQIDLVLEQIDAIHKLTGLLEPYAHVHGARLPGWRTVANDPEPFLHLGFVDMTWLERALPALLEYEARCKTDGDNLTHWDIRSDNLCITENRVVFVDWNLACLSNPELDLGFWLPSLAYEGGPQPEQIIPDAPEIAAWVSGFFAARAGLHDIPDAPRVRLVQRQQLETALPWVIRTLHLPPAKLTRI